MEMAVRARSAAVACVEAPAWSLSDAEISSALIAVHQGEQALLAAKLHLVRELDARGVAVGGPVAWLREHLRLSASSARRLVALARAVDARSVVDAALAAGTMDAEQAGTVTAVLDDLPAEVGVEVVGKAEAMLVEWAGEFAAPALRRLGERVLAHVAPEVAERTEARLLARQEQRAHAARTVSLRSIGAGCYRLTGVLDAEGAAVMTAALDPLCSPRTLRGTSPTATTAASPPHHDPVVPFADPPTIGTPTIGTPIDGTGAGGSTAGDVEASGTGPAGTEAGGAEAGRAEAGGAEAGRAEAGGARIGDAEARSAEADERSPGQRRADALIEVCRLALAGGELPANGGDRPQVTVTVPYDPMSRLLGTATLDTGDRLSATQVRRLACDAQIVPAVLDGAGQVLDLGHSRRLITGALRRALMLRDRGCAFPGCDRPPRWCDGHHIRSWLDGGPTSLDNAVLLCRRHHRTVHHDDWAVRLTTGGLAEFIPPAHLDPHRRPRRNILHNRQ